MKLLLLPVALPVLALAYSVMRFVLTSVVALIGA